MENLDHLRAVRPNRGVILVADDEVLVRNLVRIALEASGFFVLVACNGEEALELSRKFSGSIDALVTDIVMPKIDGLALRERILRERPTIKILLMSGNADQALKGAAFLRKPFDLEELKERVRKLLA
jgi:two-component system, cell cycle sensor histidine kinase and response regulator CckA